MNWVQPDSERLRAALPGLFGALTRHHYLAARGAEIATSDAGVGAAALWDPPGRWGQSSREQIAMLPAVLRAFRGRLAVGAHRHRADEGPASRGAALVSGGHRQRPVGAGRGFRAGADGVGPAALRRRLCAGLPGIEQPENIGYHERFGFRVTGEIQLPDGGPSLWPMWRDPR